MGVRGHGSKTLVISTPYRGAPNYINNIIILTTYNYH